MLNSTKFANRNRLKDLLRYLLLLGILFSFYESVNCFKAPQCPPNEPVCAGVWEDYRGYYGYEVVFGVLSDVIGLFSQILYFSLAVLTSLCMYRVAMRISRDYVSFVSFVTGEYASIRTFVLSEYVTFKDFSVTAVKCVLDVLLAEYVAVKASMTLFFNSEYAAMKATFAWNLLLLKIFYLLCATIAFVYSVKPRTFIMEPQANPRARHKSAKTLSWIAAIVSFLLLFVAFLPEQFATFLKFVDAWIKRFHDYVKHKQDAEEANCDVDWEEVAKRERERQSSEKPQTSSSSDPLDSTTVDKGKEPDSDQDDEVPLRKKRDYIKRYKEFVKSQPDAVNPSEDDSGGSRYKPVIGEVDGDIMPICLKCGKRIISVRDGGCECALTYINMEEQTYYEVYRYENQTPDTPIDDFVPCFTDESPLDLIEAYLEDRSRASPKQNPIEVVGSTSVPYHQFVLNPFGTTFNCSTTVDVDSCRLVLIANYINYRVDCLAHMLIGTPSEERHVRVSHFYNNPNDYKVKVDIPELLQDFADSRQAVTGGGLVNINVLRFGNKASVRAMLHDDWFNETARSNTETKLIRNKVREFVNLVDCFNGRSEKVIGEVLTASVRTGMFMDYDNLFAASLCTRIALASTKTGRRVIGFFTIKNQKVVLLYTMMFAVLDMIWQICLVILSIKCAKKAFWFFITMFSSMIFENESWGTRGRGRRKRRKHVNSAGQEREYDDFHPDDYAEEEDEYAEDDLEHDSWYERVYGEALDVSSVKSFTEDQIKQFKQMHAHDDRKFPREWKDVRVMKPQALLTHNSKIPMGLYADNLFQLKDATGKAFVNGFRIGNYLLTVKHALKQLAYGEVSNHKSKILLTPKYEDWGRDLVAIKVPAGKRYNARPPLAGEYCVLLAFGPQTFGKLYPEVSYGTTDSKGFYTCDSVRGNCGGVVIALTDGAVIGIHSAGSDIINLYEPLTADRIKNFSPGNPTVEKIRDVEGKMPIDIQPQCLAIPGRHVVVDPRLDRDEQLSKLGLNTPNFVYIGSVDKKGFSSNQRKPDPLVLEYAISHGVSIPFDKYELTVTQAHSVASSLNHYNRLEIDFDEDAFAMAVRWTIRLMEPFIGGSRVGKTFDLFDQLDKTTSPGFPYNIMKMSKEQAWEEYSEDIMKAAADPNYTFVMMQAMKEEIRPTDKVDRGDQRGIWGGPMSMSILGLYLFGDMAEKMHKHSNGQWFSFVGSNIYEGGWDRLYRRLSRFKKGWALDAKKWDSSLRRIILQAILFIRKSLWHPDDRTQKNEDLADNLYRNLISTIFLSPYGLFLMSLLGNPSGGPLTIDDNSIGIILNICYGWIRNCPEDQRNLASLRSNLEAAVNGDDNTFTVSDEASSFFNAETLMRSASELGITFTTDHINPRTPAELDFLSANFHPTIYGIYVPIYDTDKLLVSLYYSRRRDPCDTLIRACALRVIGYWNEPYRKTVSAFISWLIEKYHRRTDPDWQRALTAYHSDDAIERLYFGFEVGKASKDQRAPQNTLYTFLGTKTTQIKFTKQSLDNTIQFKNSMNSKEEKKNVKKAQKAERKGEAKAISREVKTLSRAEKALVQQKAVANTLRNRGSLPGKKIMRNPSLIKYLRALIDPESYYRNQQQVRVPDAFSHPTAVLVSHTSYSVTTNNAAGTATPDLGRFCFVTNPTLASLGWLYNAGPTFEQYGATGVIGQTVRFDDNLVLGANVAELDPTQVWSPATAMQAPAPIPSLPKPSRSDPPRKGQPEVGPPIAQFTSWKTYADPNAATIGGTLVTSTLAVPSQQFRGGAAESIRPVAHCIWFEPSMAAMANGGNISTALLPPGSMIGQVAPYNFNSADEGSAVWGGQGPIARWENLANVPGSYTGALSKGAYTFWLPSRLADIDMVTVADNATADFPVIIVSGQWQGNPSADSPFDGIIGVLKVTTIYEYTTVDQSRSTTKIDCVPGAFEFVQCMLKNQPTSMENPAHRSWIDKLLATAAGVVAGAGGFMVGGPAGALAAGTAAASGVYSLLKD